MTAKSPSTKKPAEQVVKDIRRATRRHFSAEDKIRIVLDGLRGEDPQATFLFVSASEVSAVAKRFDAIPFDIEGIYWSHRGEFCTFDVMIDEFGLAFPALAKLATIVRGADTARLDIAPEAAGLLAVSLGLSRMYGNDLEQLDAGMLVYDALYRWCRDASDETHNWPGTGGRK